MKYWTEETSLSLSKGEDWPTPSVPLMRRIGWLDQRGRVYLAIPPAAEFDGGSLTALLIALDE